MAKLERLLGRKEVMATLGIGKNTAYKLFTEEWNKPGGTKLICNEYKVPEGYLARWLASRDLAPGPARKEPSHA